MINNRRVEKAHRALSAYLRPRLRKGVDVEFTSAFVGADDENIDARLPAIIDEVARLTHGELAMDASEKDLFARMHAAIADEGTTNMSMPDEIVKKVLTFLQPKLTPDELRHVFELLMRELPKALHDDGTIKLDTAEDARNAQGAFDQRYPSAKRIRIEPDIKPEQPRHATPDPAGFFARFPNARRIGQAL
jgi:hypothetical protein